MNELFGPLFIKTSWDKITRYKEVEPHEKGGIGRKEMPNPGHEFCWIGWCISPIATIAVSLTGMVHNHQDGQAYLQIIEIVKSLHTSPMILQLDDHFFPYFSTMNCQAASLSSRLTSISGCIQVSSTVAVSGRAKNLQEMMQRAQALGANAIVGIDIDYETIGANGSMLMVATSGTAVVI